MSPRRLGERLELLWNTPELLQQETHWLRRAWLRLAKAARDPEPSAAALRAFSEQEPTLDRWREQRDGVYRELTENVGRLEAIASVHGSVDAALVDWLLGVHQWALSMDHAVEAPSRHTRLALMTGLASRARVGPALRGGRQAGSVLALAGIDALLDEAAAESDRLSRRRRLLEAARRLLLDAEVAAGERTPFAERRALVAVELEQVGRLEGLGLRADVALGSQIDRARRRGDTRGALAASAGLTYLRAGTRRPVSRALEALAESLKVDGSAGLPATVERAIIDSFQRARASTEAALANAGPSEALALRRRRSELTQSARHSLLRMALGVDGLFDVGGGLERDRIDAPVAVQERVRYPTRELELQRATDPADVPDAIIDDPRLLIHHLATRRLLVRRFRRRRVRKRRRPRVRAAVRFYLLDGSSSMLGDRARMRDAILVAELASLVSRLERPTGRIHSLLYYRYFNAAVEPTRRVASVADALAAIESILGRARTGGTNIHQALADTLALIDEARRSDVELTRAQVVLVTDGLANVEPETIRAMQASLDVPVRVSIILLGDESPELRELALLQRTAGLRVLYHHVPDDELARLSEQSAGGWPTDPALAEPSAPIGALEELEGLDEPTRFCAPPEELAEALRELGLEQAELAEGDLAKLDGARRDRVALHRRFDRLFPRLDVRMPGVPDAADVQRVALVDALSVIVEVLMLGTPTAEEAMVDAISLLERLLRVRGLTPSEYLAVADAHAAELGPAIDAVRELCQRP